MCNRYPKKLKNCNKCKMNNYNNTANLKICSSSPRKNCNNKNLKNNKNAIVNLILILVILINALIIVTVI